MAGVSATRTVAPLDSGAPDWSERFVAEVYEDIARTRFRRNRCITDPSIAPKSNAAEIAERLRLYLDTGMRGYLIDVARYSMWEWNAQEPEEVRQGVCL